MTNIIKFLMNENNTKLYEKILTLSNHGRSHNQIKQFWPEQIGYKYKLSNVQAAIGLAQLERVDRLPLPRSLHSAPATSGTVVGFAACIL